MTFKIGDKVICIDDKNRSHPDRKIHEVTEGNVYTVVGDQLAGYNWLTIIPRDGGQGSCCLYADRFQPYGEEVKDCFISYRGTMQSSLMTEQAALEWLKKHGQANTKYAVCRLLKEYTIEVTRTVKEI